MNKTLGFSAEEMLCAIMSDELRAVFHESLSQAFYEEDKFSVQVKLVCGDTTWMRYRLRDRSTDGPGWKSTPLVD